MKMTQHHRNVTRTDDYNLSSNLENTQVYKRLCIKFSIFMGSSCNIQYPAATIPTKEEMEDCVSILKTCNVLQFGVYNQESDATIM